MNTRSVSDLVRKRRGSSTLRHLPHPHLPHRSTKHMHDRLLHTLGRDRRIKRIFG
jgi:hypothetical protein